MAPQEQGRGWDTERGGGRNGATGDGIALGVKHVLHVERTVGGPCSGLPIEWLVSINPAVRPFLHCQGPLMGVLS